MRLGSARPPASAAFPGRDGRLVVATGRGLALVAPATGHATAICTNAALCGRPAQPRFSPNGRAVTFVDASSHRLVVLAAGGSCLWCLLGARLTTVTGAVDNAVWSSRGLVAVVRGGWIWVGRPGHGKLRRLARGRSPSSSPDGARLALAKGGYVWVVRVADGRARRLVRGAAPAWSPSGGRIAYLAPGGALEVVGVAGGRPRRVGSVIGTAIDWQPPQLYARDTRGTRLIDSAPAGKGSAIGNVTLGGDSLTLTWTHGGTPRRLTLH